MSAAKKLLIETVEEKLATIYRFPLITSAVPFLMNKEQIISESSEVQPPRAAVFLTQVEDTLEIGIYIQDELLRILDTHNPHHELNTHNLDAYCVLIEELSHFHLLLQRSEIGRGVSKLELEWQGEIDKLLLAGLLMSEQKNESCFKSLYRSIFEDSTVSSDPVYQEASHYAAKCWHRLLSKSRHHRQVAHEIMPVLQAAYQGCWTKKMRIIQGL
ncbi:MAG: hypothetical protein H7318_15845 [Oligoflexus sp.]|nr:hypothetical protein [Oligoflexus sp.]